jgi:hypothetical protein
VDGNGIYMLATLDTSKDFIRNMVCPSHVCVVP